MEDKPSWQKRLGSELLKVVLGVVAGLALLGGMAYGVPAYLNWQAGEKAEAFCAKAKRGADIAPLVAEFEKAVGDRRVLHYEADDGSHAFLFEGFALDNATCSVAVAGGKVVSARVVRK